MAEPPRRRSTVREPAPMFSSGSMSDVQPAPAHEAPPPAPAPEPAAATPEPAAAGGEAKPRRFGWWNKKG
jgi:ribonuclease E